MTIGADVLTALPEVFIAGLAMVCLAAVIYTESTPIPGPAALLPCLGAALIIWSGPSVRGSAGRLLANRTMAGIGKISYSMYLWHWPMIVYLPVIGLSYKTLSTWGGHLVLCSPAGAIGTVL